MWGLYNGIRGEDAYIFMAHKEKQINHNRLNSVRYLIQNNLQKVNVCFCKHLLHFNFYKEGRWVHE